MNRAPKQSRRTSADNLHTNDFAKDIAACKMYVAGNDEQGHSVLVQLAPALLFWHPWRQCSPLWLRKQITRKRADRVDNPDGYLKYMVYSLETAVRAMQQGQEKWVWIMDLAGAWGPNAALGRIA